MERARLYILFRGKALSFGLLFIAASGFGQTDLSLRQAIDLAVAWHPLLGAAQNRIDVATGLRTQAGLPPNPRFVLQSENTRFTGQPGFAYGRDADTFAYLQNIFETGGKRQRRVETADEVVRRDSFERDLLKRQISGRVAQAYWSAVGAARVHNLLLENQKNFQRVVEYHEIRVQQGAMAEADLIRVRLEAQRLAIAANQAMLEVERARIGLFREMGRTEFPAVRFTENLEAALTETPRFDVEAALEQRVESRVARAALAVTQSNLRLQQANARPNFELLFGYKRTAGFNTMIGGFQMDLPLFNKNQGNVAAASSDIRVSESNLAATNALIRAEVQAAQTEYEIRRKEAVEFFRPLLDRAAETYRIAEAAYREGGSDLLRLLDAQRVQIEAQTSYARALADLRLSLVNVAIATGVEP